VTVTLRLYAGLRERAGGDRLEVDLPAGSDVGGLRGAVAKACPALAPALPSCRFAIADEFVADSAPVPPHVPIDLIPPVSGG